jgi:hypothetical protein
MWVFYALILYGIGCAFFVFVMLMGPSPTWRNTFVGTCNRWLVALPGNATYLCCLVRSGFNKERATARADACFEYFAESQNPVVQIFYALLVGVTLYFFYFHGVAETMSWTELIAVNHVVAVSIGFYLLAWLVDPGTVEKDDDDGRYEQNPSNFRFAHDGLQYQADQNCPTCNVVKPARSKHCKICKRCVRRFDHHCPWINTDVGENNLKWFHAFLLSHVVMSAVVAFYSFRVPYTFMLSEKARLISYMVQRGIYDPVQQQELLPKWHIFLLYSVQQKTTAGVVFIFAALIAALLLGFWFMNFLHVLRNQTTNEQHKISDLKEYLDEREQQNNNNNNKAKKALDELLEADESATAEKEEEEKKEQEGKCKHQDQQVSPKGNTNLKITLNRETLAASKKFYSGSYFANIMEAFFASTKPASSEALGKKFEAKLSSMKTTPSTNKKQESKKKK